MSSAAAEPGEHVVGDAVRRTKRSAWLTRLGLLLLAALVTVAVVQLVGRIDWPAVWDALLHLTWWQPLVLLGVVVVRQVLNALPLSLYIPGVSVLRATINDLGAILMSAVAPPPSDLALRVGMFSSWGVPTTKGLAGTVMNTLTFYIVRFSAPLVGFLLLAIVDEPAGLRLLDLVCVGIALTILVGVLLVVRSDQLATRVGSWAGRTARKVRRQVDPDAWVRACVDFRDQIASRFRYGFPRSLVGLFGMLATDLAVLTLCLRFVGVAAARRASGGHRHRLPVRLSPHPVPLLRARDRGCLDPGGRGRVRWARGRGRRGRRPGGLAGLHRGGADRDGRRGGRGVASGMARERRACGDVPRGNRASCRRRGLTASDY